MLDYISNVINNQPSDWLKLTTHRLDIYNEALAKTQFLEQFETLYENNNFETAALSILPTAFDYIRLGHPLSCILEWAVAQLNDVPADNVVSFASKTAPILAILRKNLLDNKKNTQIFYTEASEKALHQLDFEVLKNTYSYVFEVHKITSADQITEHITTADVSRVFISQEHNICEFKLIDEIDFHINIHAQLGSIVLVNGEANADYVSEIQHVRRRETIAMTPAKCHMALSHLVEQPIADINGLDSNTFKEDKDKVIGLIKNITNTDTSADAKVLIASSGLSIQYAILMGLIHHAHEQHQGKAIKIIVPPNCYGGTNDQARRVAACLEGVEVMDLAVDGGNDMVEGIHAVLDKTAEQDAVPLIIAEIPTNPRVEVPDLNNLKEALSKQRTTPNGAHAVEPVFILDQTFCPNVHFLGDQDILSNVRTISFASGSKFPSGGQCTAGYCVGNSKTVALMEKIEQHLKLCDNEATPLQMQILAKQLPSMKQRIQDAYENTREFVNFIQQTLPEAHINFVSEELASQGFTPSVFSLDLPTKGNSAEEKEAHKRALNHKLINLMITEIPNESKYCVSYGQLKGCYWTIPATSTQGTTKEGDKDYIARVAVSPNLDLDRHKQVFKKFVESM